MSHKISGPEDVELPKGGEFITIQSRRTTSFIKVANELDNKSYQ